MPDEEFVFKVRAKTVGGYAPYSETEKVVGLYNEKGNVFLDWNYRKF